MNAETISRALIRLGILLFSLGLLTGAAIPYFNNPRTGLSGHLEGVMSGMFLAVLALLRDRVNLTPRTSTLSFRIASYGACVNWAAATLAAIFGTGALTPIPGDGYHGRPRREHCMAFVQFSPAVSLIPAVVFVLRSLMRSDRRAR